MVKRRQEVINVHLANILARLGLKVKAEVIGVKRKAPDLVIIHPRFGYILGEAEVGRTWDDRQARKKLESKANNRFKDPQFNFVDYMLLIIYPESVVKGAAEVSDEELPSMIERTKLGLGLSSRTDYGAEHAWWDEEVKATRIPAILDKWLSSRVRPLHGVVEDILSIVEKLTVHIRSLAGQMSAPHKSIWKDIAKQLEIDWEVLEDDRDRLYLTSKTLFTLVAIVMVIYELARQRYPHRLPPLSTRALPPSALSSALGALKDINYVEIVEMLEDEILKVPPDPVVERLLGELYKTISANIDVFRTSGWEAFSAIYQRLLSETYRKAYATFYTKLPAAKLLAELAVESADDVVADPACGTGSLLLSSFYVRLFQALSPSRVEEELSRGRREPLIDRVFRSLLSRTIGMDALKTALALTVGNLTIASQAVKRGPLNMYHMPVGTERAGSLDMLRPIEAEGLPEKERLFGKITVVLMNPPFTRSDRIPDLIGDVARKAILNIDLEFGGRRLSNIFVAGLAKPFMALADKLLVDGGRIGAVLPNSILNRPTWADVREGLMNCYMLEYVVVSWAEGIPNFSSDTLFREILLVVRKRDKNDRSERPLRIINLLEPVDELSEEEVSIIAHSAKAGKRIAISPTGRVLAEIAEVHKSILEKWPDNLYRLMAFKSRELLEWHMAVLDKCCVLLDDIFTVGSVVDHSEGLTIQKRELAALQPDVESYEAVWGSGCDVVRSMKIAHTHIILVADPKRAKVKFWKNLSNYTAEIFVPRRLQLDTQCVLAFTTTRPCISNVWWPLKLGDKDNRLVLKLLCFMNSIFGLIHLLGERLETRGLWVEFKKSHLRGMPMPDFRRMSLMDEEGERLRTLMAVKLSRLDKYVEYMASIERATGNWSSALQETLSRDNEHKPRAVLDSITYAMLNRLCPTLTPPDKLYELLLNEIRTLRSIMEPRERGTNVVKDKGYTRTRIAQKSLEKWLAASDSD